ncbi:MAG: hypothetical protein JNM88_12305 [Chitinophagaceae bacterium]|nr:hypothetical protein [Chitinophagaceae bacterium]
MKTHLFILLAFLLTITARYIPVGSATETFGEYTLELRTALLPGIVLFGLVALVVTVILAIITYYRYKQPMKGGHSLVRTDMYILPHFITIAVWGAVVLIIELLLSRFIHLFRGMAPYFAIILAMVLLYKFCLQWSISTIRPVFITLNGEKIQVRGVLGNSTRNIKNLVSAAHDIKTNAILLQFEEGLHNVSLFLSDYEPDELTAFVNELKNRAPQITAGG